MEKVTSIASYLLSRYKWQFGEDKKIDEQDRKLNEQKRLLQNAVEGMKQQGMDDATIASLLGVTEEEIKSF